MYLVGRDLPAEELFFTADEESLSVTIFYSCTSDSDIRDIFSGGTRYFYTPEEGDYVRIRGGKAELASQAKLPEPENGWYSAGMYRIGTDLPAGTYTLSPNEDYDLHYEIRSDAGMDYDSILEQDWSEEPVTVTLKEGQYFSLSYGTFRAGE